MSTLILHIGYPKTGTSSIQWFLHANRDGLRRQGVYYPTTGQSDDHAHHKLAFALSENPYERWTDRQKARLVEDLGFEIDNCGCDTVVLSSELFLYRLEQMMQASRDFKDILEAHTLRVICFLRRQDTYLESQYRQFVWDPMTKLTDDVDVFLRSDYVKGGDYYLAVSAWAGFVGKENILPIVYEQAQNTDGCTKRFCSLLGVDTTKLPGACLNVRRNVSISGTLGTEIMRIINTYPELSDQQRIELAQRAMELDRTTNHLPIPERIFSADQCTRVQTLFLESNQKLAAEFVRQPLEGFWFCEHPDS